MGEINTNGISFNLKFSQKEYIKFLFYISYSNLSIKLVTGLGVIMVFVLLLSNNEDRFSSSSIIIPYFLILMSILFPIIIYNSAKKSFKNRLVHEEKVYTIKDDCLTIKSDSTFLELKWSDFQKIKKSKNAQYFYISKNQAIIIPSRCLNDQEYKDVFILAKTNIKPASQKRTLFFIGIYLVIFLVVIGVIRFISSNNIQP
jgi:hypothetical protein